MTRLLLLLLAFYTVRAAAGNATHSVLLYRHFFPAWDPYLQDYIKGACKDQIADYRNATFSDPRISYTVLDCMLKQFPEFRKVRCRPPSTLTLASVLTCSPRPKQAQPPSSSALRLPSSNSSLRRHPLPRSSPSAARSSRSFSPSPRQRPLPLPHPPTPPPSQPSPPLCHRIPEAGFPSPSHEHWATTLQRRTLCLLYSI